MINFSVTPFQEIAMIVIILIGVSAILIELQLRRLRKSEERFGEKIGKDESVLYSAEKSLLTEIKEMRGALEQWKELENKGGVK